MRIVLGCCVAGFLVAAGAASAQPSPNPPAPAEDAAPAPRRQAARTPVPPRSVTVTNMSDSALTGLEIAGDGKSARLAKPLPPNGKTVLRLPVMKGCTVTVSASFAEGGDSEPMSQDICRDKALTFRD